MVLSIILSVVDGDQVYLTCQSNGFRINVCARSGAHIFKKLGFGYNDDYSLIEIFR